MRNSPSELQNFRGARAGSLDSTMVTRRPIRSPLSTSRNKFLSRPLGARLVLLGAIFALTIAIFTPSSNRAEAAPPVMTLVNLDGHYPIGVADPSDPSGYAPPGPTALVGYRESYVTQFNGATMPAGWDVFTGIPGGDPGGHFSAAHVQVTGGLLELLTYQDPAYGDGWVTGGVCQCGLARVYGAYFVRSRVTGKGPNEVELLWPANNQWPPEIDFNETGGSIVTSSTSLHYGADNTVIRTHIDINMTQWHTWGVIWTPTSVTYTVDGRVWGRLSTRGTIPNIPMTLDFEQRTICSEDRQCPTTPVNMYVDWVAEYIKD